MSQKLPNPAPDTPRPSPPPAPPKVKPTVIVVVGGDTLLQEALRNVLMASSFDDFANPQKRA